MTLSSRFAGYQWLGVAYVNFDGEVDRMVPPAGLRRLPSGVFRGALGDVDAVVGAGEVDTVDLAIGVSAGRGEVVAGADDGEDAAAG